MGTIITHGKSQWGRANKHKRKDPEFDEELANKKDIAVTKPIDNAEIIKEMTDSTEIGKTMVRKIYDSTNDVKEVLKNNKNVNQQKHTNIIEHNKYGNPIMKNRSGISSISEEVPEKTSTHLNHKKVTKKIPENPIVLDSKSLDGNILEDNEIENTHGISFIEDIDGWEEKLKLLNEDIARST